MAKSSETLPTITLKLWEETKQKQPKTHEKSSSDKQPHPQGTVDFFLNFDSFKNHISKII
jgi:hypothetical protein